MYCTHYVWVTSKHIGIDYEDLLRWKIKFWNYFCDGYYFIKSDVLLTIAKNASQDTIQPAVIG